ncbi:MAG: hypothetical protein DMF51_09770 [Acidobacteria bacterium]|nr:MAG: hypothetical protein DMF51_09770 [Acidobacteriota bacterium]
MSEAIQNAIAAHASSGLLLVVLLAWLEYVFPPSPGDSTMLFAFFLAGRGTMSLPAVAAAALSGSILGAMTAYAIGARLGRSYFFLRSAWARAELARIERWYARHGARFLLINRFLPGVRGFFLYAAGGDEPGLDVGGGARGVPALRLGDRAVPGGLRGPGGGAGEATVGPGHAFFLSCASIFFGSAWRSGWSGRACSERFKYSAARCSCPFSS